MPDRQQPAVLDIVETQMALRKWRALTAADQHRPLDLSADQIGAIIEIIDSASRLVRAIESLPGPSIVVRRAQT